MPRPDPARHAKPKHLRPSDSSAWLIFSGIVTIIAFFGILGGWATVAPLDSAVVASAVVKVDGNRKSVDHLDGGIIKSILVRDGDHVAKNDALVTLDDSSLDATVAALDQQWVNLLALKARLSAESLSMDKVAFPAALTSRMNESNVAAAMRQQDSEFVTRRQALDGQKQVIAQRIAQLQDQIAGSAAQKQADQEQLDSVKAEQDGLNVLFAKGMINHDRILELQRTVSGIKGQIGQADADIARANAAIEENKAQSRQLDKDRATEVANSLRDTDSKLLDTTPRLKSSQQALDRTTVRAPYAGTVVGLAVFSIGGVVTPGERVLDIVPDDTPLTVEAQISVTDIADLHAGLNAEVHLTAYDQRTLPIMHGKIASLSADRLTDQRTGTSYYTALVEIDKAELAASPNVSLYPGMPATVMIPTGARTALAYLVGPFADSFDRAFRQR